MPVLLCPNCTERVSVAAGTPRVRCGSCKAVFDTSEAFEDAPASAPAKPAAKPAPAKPTPPRPAARTPAPAPAKAAPRPKVKRPPVELDDDEDDDEDHPLANRRKQSPEEIRRDNIILRDELRRATLGLTLLFTAGWLRAGAMGLLTFVILMFWGRIVNGLELLVMIGAFLSVGFWVLSIIGNGFLLSGPNRNGTYGFAGAMLGVSLLFLIMLGVLLKGDADGSMPSVETERIHITWFNILTNIPSLPMQMFGSMLGAGAGFAASGIVMLLGVLELSRMIFFGLYMRSAVAIVRNASGKKAAMAYVIMWGALLGMLLVMGFVFATIMKQSGDSGLTTMATAYLLLLNVAVLAMAVFEVKLTGRIKDDLRYRDSGAD